MEEFSSGLTSRPSDVSGTCILAPRIHERRKLGLRGDRSLRQLSAFIVTVAVLRGIGFKGILCDAIQIAEEVTT